MNFDEELKVWSPHLIKKLEKEGLPLKVRLFAKFCEKTRQRVFNEKDSVIAVTGDTGMGKTNFALVSSIINFGYGVNFSSKNICYSSSDLPNIVQQATSSQFNSYVIDEAIDVADSRDFGTKLNKALMKIAVKNRKNHNIYYWCIPDFTDLDTRLRNKLVRYWVHIFEQTNAQERDTRIAYAAVFVKDKNPFNPDKWGVGDTKKYAITNTIHLRKFFRRHVRSYLGEMAIPILPKILEEKYEEQSLKELVKSGEAFKLQFGKKEEPIQI